MNKLWLFSLDAFKLSLNLKCVSILSINVLDNFGHSANRDNVL